MKFLHTFALLVLGWMTVASAAPFSTNEFTDPVTTSSGPVIGEIREGVQFFKGIAYALPPIGDLRWKPPQPVVEWKNPLLVTEFGPACPQPLTRASMSDPVTSTDAFGPVGPLSEDCLYLNVWAPTTSSEPVPVFFWIHGGGFQAGSASQQMYDGANLAKKGAVVVTIDFRTGPFGFLAHPDLTAESPDKTSGNYGLLDMVAALKWVKANIKAFGGDPEKVTIMGQSGGGVAVLSLMTSPLATGLFQRAICHSGMMPPIWRMRDKEQGALGSMESLGVAFGERLGVLAGKDAPAGMRSKSWQEIMQANRIPTGPDSGQVANMGGAGIVCTLEVDGLFATESPDAIFAKGAQQAVPLLIGNVLDEGTMFVPPFETMERYRELLAQAVGAANVEEALRFYPARDVNSARNAYIQFTNDMMFSISRRHAQWNSAKQKQTWRYEFTRTPKWEVGKWFSCFHGSDLPYVFGNFLPVLEYDKTDRKLSETIMDYWVQFARTGDPNQPGAVEWPAFTTEGGQYLILDQPVKADAHLQQKACDLWDRWMTSYVP